MHSTRMRTARLLLVSLSIHWGVSASGPGSGVSASGPGGGVCLWSQGGVSQHAMGQRTPQPPSPCGQTNTCKNITFVIYVCRLAPLSFEVRALRMGNPGSATRYNRCLDTLRCGILVFSCIYSLNLTFEKRSTKPRNL